MGLILAGGVLAMSTAAILIRYAQAEGTPSLVIATYRLSVATLILSLIAIRQQAWKDYAKLNVKEFGILVLSGVLLGLHFATWITSLDYTSVVNSVVLVSTTPLWIAATAPFLLREKTPHLTWAGIAIAIIGGGIIGWAGQSAPGGSGRWGDLLALTGALLMAGYLTIGRSTRKKVALVAYLWVVYGTAAVLLLAWSIIKGYRLTGYSAAVAAAMIALGVVPQLIGHSAANYALRFFSATMVAIAVLGEPIGSTALAIIFLDEWPVPLQLAGGTLILLGIALTSLVENRRGLMTKSPETS